MATAPTLPARSTYTQNQLDSLDDDGNPHRPDDPDEVAGGALIRRASAALATQIKARPLAWVGAGVGVGLVLGMFVARR
ncbi:MAG: hypothetical protein K8W52_21995 [Deltaproteobacteria bacterium]|nr:hypothetical protein [Deltaproteobacteria bacterium]